MNALLLPVVREWYAIESSWVREVVAAPLLVPLPTAPAAVLGVFNLRGEIVPTFDVARLLGVGEGPNHPFVVVVETALGPAGLAAHAVPEMGDLGSQLGAADLPGTVARFAVDGRVATLVAVDELLAPARIGGART